MQKRPGCHSSTILIFVCNCFLFPRFGTEFKSGVDLSNKRLGIGVFNGFIGDNHELQTLVCIIRWLWF